MLELTKIPDITFLSPAGVSILSVAASADRIAGRADFLKSRFADGSRIGVVNKTGPDLVLDWLSVVTAGLVPTILQYPTVKQNRHTWAMSIRNLVETCHLDGLIVKDGLSVPNLPPECELFPSTERHTKGNDQPIGGGGQIIQMSSGTTGHRKAIAFSLAQIETHIACYNQTIGITPNDVVVSWLPLYHDMGFIACFLMPMLIGSGLVLIDPGDWVQEPGSLYTAIERWHGTVCYMPNFGFEVMARCAADRSRRFPSMRKWVSCAEPISASTVRRFLSATATDESCFSACYAMAENVFAITQSNGLDLTDVDGKAAVSCGPPIANTEIQIVDGEIYIRSPTSLRSYLDGTEIVSRDGFFASGDMGIMVDRGLVLLGRKRDVLIQAGTKYFLSDLDLSLNELFPDLRGRACSVAVWGEREGTEHPLFLIERQRFFDRADLPKMADAVRGATDLSHFEMQFIPPLFIVKTSSGKINRAETLRQWQAAEKTRLSATAHERGGLHSAILRYFSVFPLDIAVGELLDSLGTAILQMILSDYSKVYDKSMTLGQILAFAGDDQAMHSSNESDLVPCVNIISCADGRQWSWMDTSDVKRLEDLLGCPVHFEHICTPPVPVLLSDLVFFDYFMPGRADAKFGVVGNLLAKIRSASMLIFDDIAELGFGTGVFPVLSHRFERDPAADLFCFRWQRYSTQHDALPITVADTRSLDKEMRAKGFRLLKRYLGIPLFRFAVLDTHRNYTEDWEHVEIIPNNSLALQKPANPQTLRASLFSFIENNAASLPRTPGPRTSSYRNSDLPHFCCSYINSETLDVVMQRYDSFAVIGPPQSVPYIRHHAKELGKPINYIPHWNRNPVDGVLDLHTCAEACILITGAWGAFQGSDKPIFQVMGAYPRHLVDNLPAEFEALRHRFEGAPPESSGQSFYKYWH